MNRRGKVRAVVAAVMAAWPSREERESRRDTEQAVMRAADELTAAGPQRRLLELLVLLSPDGVRRAHLHRAGELGLLGVTASTAEVDDALGLLVGSSLVEVSSDGLVLGVPETAARILREHMAKYGKLLPAARNVVRFLQDRQVPPDAIWRKKDEAEEWVRQVIALNGNLPASLWTTITPGALALSVHNLRAWAQWYLNETGADPAYACAFGERLYADTVSLLGEEHPETLNVRNNLAIAYQAAGRTEEAILLHEQNHAARVRFLGEDHLDSLRTGNNLAHAYLIAGRVDDSIDLQERVFELRTRLLGEDHPETLVSRHNLATAYQYAGRAIEAIMLHEDALTIRIRTLGNDNPITLNTRGSLASAYQQAGFVNEAIALYEQIHTAYRRLLGEDHPETLVARHNLAAAYRSAGRTDEALRLQQSE